MSQLILPVVVLGTLGILGCGTPPTSSPTEEAAPADIQVARTGPYLGQVSPGPEPQMFAPGFVSTGMAERDVAMTPDGKEFYYTTVLGAGFEFSTIVMTRWDDGGWSVPEVASFSGRYKDMEPAISPDGTRFFFLSYRPADGTSDPVDNEDLWVMDRQEKGWGEPRHLGSSVNTEQAEFFPSITRDGTLYFTRRSEDRTEAIFRSRWLDGAFQPAEKLPPQVNAAPTQFNAFIDPDERYLIVCSWGREDSLGGVDYYIVFRSPDDSWSGPVNLGEKINSATGQEWSPYVSPDGKYFFFMSSRSNLIEQVAHQPMTYTALQTNHHQPMNGNTDIWWVEADFLEKLRPAP